MDKKLTVLEEAAQVIDGPRQKAYGHPINNHALTAEYWTIYLRSKGKLPQEIELDYEDVCIMMMLKKISRQSNCHKRDNLVDIPGYARNIEMCRQELGLED